METSKYMTTRVTCFFVITFLSCLFLSRAFGGDNDFLAALALEEKSAEKAYKIYEELSGVDAPLADHASYKWIARGYQKGEVAALIKPCENHITRFRYSRFTPEIRLILIEGLISVGEWKKAIKEAGDFQKDYPDMFLGRVATLKGEALFGAGRHNEAARELGRAAYLYRDASWRERAKYLGEKMRKDGHGKIIPPEKNDLSEMIDRAIYDRRLWDCGRLARTSVGLYGGWKTRLKEVDCLLIRRKRKDARRLLKSIENRFPRSRSAQGALMLRWAMAEKGRDFKGKPRTSYYKVMADYSGTEAALHARYLIGFQNFDSYDFLSAAKHMGIFLEKWQGKYLLDDALWQGGFSFYLNGDFSKAAKLFTRFIKEFPDHKDRDKVVYWRGRAYLNMGDKSGAKDDFLWVAQNLFGTYYGLAAQVRLEQMGETSFILKERLCENVPWEFMMPPMPIPRLAPEWAQEGGGGDNFDGGAKIALEYFAEFGHKGIKRLASNFLALYHGQEISLAFDEAKYIHKNLSDAPYGEYIAGIMFSLCQRNLWATYASNKTAGIIRRGALFDPHRINARRQFPLLFWELIQDVSKRHELDPYLVIALVKQESAFQVSAKSWAGARGLFQIMPSTARWIAKKRGIKNFKTSDLYKPENSADFGTWYFKRLMTNNDNDVAKALAGYNAGGSRAKRWWGANPGREYDEMIELIGFSETRKYVKTILRNWEMYSRLYRDKFEPALARDTIFVLLLDKVPAAKED